MVKSEDNKQQKKASPVLDLSEFVTEVDRFSRLIEPFALVFYMIDDIRRWRFRNGTIAVWLLCNAACISLTQAAVFVLASGLVIAIATLSLFQVHTQFLNKFLPENKKASKLSGKEGSKSSDDAVQNFKFSLIEMHDFVVKSNEYLSYFYSILKWDAFGSSVIYHMEACMFLLSIVMFPARWNCFLLINWFFLCHPHIIRKGFRFFKEKWFSQKQPLSPTDEKSSFEHGTSVVKEQISNGKNEKDEDSCENAIDDDGDSSDVDLTDKFGDSSMVSLDPSPKKPGMVARLMEIKKRRKQIASASFALKETIVVCCSCHSVLVTQGDATSDAAEKQGHGPG